MIQALKRWSNLPKYKIVFSSSCNLNLNLVTQCVKLVFSGGFYSIEEKLKYLPLYVPWEHSGLYRNKKAAEKLLQNILEIKDKYKS